MRAGLRTTLLALLRFAVLLFVLPLAAFVVVGSVAPEFHLDRYTYEQGEGYVPQVRPPDADDRAGVGQLAGFFTRASLGLVGGAPGRSREAADRSLGTLLAGRAGPSLGILAVATGVSLLGLAAGVSAGAWRARRGWRTPRWLRALGAPGATALEGLPLPFVAMIAFVLVVRLVPRDGVLESDAAMVIWAGLALAAGDAVLHGVIRGAGLETRRGLSRPYVLAARLRGERPLAALWPNLLPVLGAHLRAAVLLFLGGLVIVEPALGINGLGETFKDIVTDRAGTDVLLFAGVLWLFAVPVATVDLVATVGRGAGLWGRP